MRGRVYICKCNFDFVNFCLYNKFQCDDGISLMNVLIYKVISILNTLKFCVHIVSKYIHILSFKIEFDHSTAVNVYIHM